ncbi:hypothetical protein HDU84_008850 [Entophlyctis sp. JEL0112]|nr:hypothetical protein HDU84_008850 [Entophlyctis sp. JEL0112]
MLFLTNLAFQLKEKPPGVRDTDEILADGTAYIDLTDLSYQTKDTLQHDVSLTRQDAFFGDNSVPQPHLVEQMIASSSDGKVITANDLAKFRVERYRDSLNRNPELVFGMSQLNAAMVETALTLNVLGRNQSIPVDYVKSFFMEGRIPDGFVRLEKPATFNGLVALAAENLVKWEWFYWQVNPKVELSDDSEEISIKVTAAHGSRGLSQLSLDLIIYHTDVISKDAVVHESKAISLNSLSVQNFAAHFADPPTTVLNAVVKEPLAKEILAVSVVPHAGLLPFFKSWSIDSLEIVSKKSGMEWRFPVAITLEAEVSKHLFNERVISNAEGIPETILILKKNEEKKQ